MLNEPFCCDLKLGMFSEGGIDGIDNPVKSESCHVIIQNQIVSVSQPSWFISMQAARSVTVIEILSAYNSWLS